MERAFFVSGSVAVAAEEASGAAGAGTIATVGASGVGGVASAEDEAFAVLEMEAASVTVSGVIGVGSGVVYFNNVAWKLPTPEYSLR